MKFIIDFLGELLKLIQVQATAQPPDKAKENEEVQNAYKWFMDKCKESKQKEIREHNEPFMMPGKIYVFKYEPEKDRYEYFDKHPIALCLGKMPAAKGFMNVCINLSWYPPAARQYIVSEIRKMYKPMYDKEILKNPMDAIKQRPVEMDLYNIKERLDLFGFSWAIRCYLPARIKSPKVVVCYEHWDKVIKMDQPRIFPELQGSKVRPLFDIYREFERVYLKYQRDNKGEIKKKRDVAKKQLRYKFIK